MTSLLGKKALPAAAGGSFFSSHLALFDIYSYSAAGRDIKRPALLPSFEMNLAPFTGRFRFLNPRELQITGGANVDL
jgi:hypothetical protein